MSIEALYPSRRQSQAHNPLFARQRRVRRFCVMAALIAAGAGLALAQIVPVDAQAHDVPARETAMSKTPAPTPIQAPLRKPVRVISIFSAR